MNLKKKIQSIKKLTVGNILTQN